MIEKIHNESLSNEGWLGDWLAGWLNGWLDAEFFSDILLHSTPLSLSALNNGRQSPLRIYSPTCVTQGGDKQPKLMMNSVFNRVIHMNFLHLLIQPQILFSLLLLLRPLLLLLLFRFTQIDSWIFFSEIFFCEIILFRRSTWFTKKHFNDGRKKNLQLTKLINQSLMFNSKFIP